MFSHENLLRRRLFECANAKIFACDALLKTQILRKFKYLASKSEREVGGGGGSPDRSERTLTYVRPYHKMSK